MTTEQNPSSEDDHGMPNASGKTSKWTLVWNSLEKPPENAMESKYKLNQRQNETHTFGG